MNNEDNDLMEAYDLEEIEGFDNSFGEQPSNKASSSEKDYSVSDSDLLNLMKAPTVVDTPRPENINKPSGVELSSGVIDSMEESEHTETEDTQASAQDTATPTEDAQASAQDTVTPSEDAQASAQDTGKPSIKFGRDIDDNDETTGTKAVDADEEQPAKKITGVEDIDHNVDSSIPHKTIDSRPMVDADTVSESDDTNGIAPINTNESYVERYRSKKNLQNTYKVLENKKLTNGFVGNNVTYEIDPDLNKTTFEISAFRTKDKIFVTESDKHIEMEGGNLKEQADMMVKYAKAYGWLDLAVWGDQRFANEVKRIGIKHDINVIHVATKNEALNIRIIDKKPDAMPLHSSLSPRYKEVSSKVPAPNNQESELPEDYFEHKRINQDQRPTLKPSENTNAEKESSNESSFKARAVRSM